MLAKFTNCLQIWLTLRNVPTLAGTKWYVLLMNSALLRRMRCSNVSEEENSTFQSPCLRLRGGFCWYLTHKSMPYTQANCTVQSLWCKYRIKFTLPTFFGYQHFQNWWISRFLCLGFALRCDYLVVSHTLLALQFASTLFCKPWRWSVSSSSGGQNFL